MGTFQHRSSEPITNADLGRLAELALADFQDYFKRYKRTSRVLLICLCQGGARHFIKPTRVLDTDRKGGVNDFDLWGFVRDGRSDPPFNPRRHRRLDFGPSKFGRNPDEPHWTGRRIDVFGRSISLNKSETPIQAVQRRLHDRPKGSSWWWLAQGPMVAIWPDEVRGQVIWKPD